METVRAIGGLRGSEPSIANKFAYRTALLWVGLRHNICINTTNSDEKLLNQRFLHVFRCKSYRFNDLSG